MYIAHEKDFCGDNKDDDTEEQLENIWEAISNIRGEICQIKDEQQKKLNYASCIWNSFTIND